MNPNELVYGNDKIPFILLNLCSEKCSNIKRIIFFQKTKTVIVLKTKNLNFIPSQNLCYNLSYKSVSFQR